MIRVDSIFSTLLPKVIKYLLTIMAAIFYDVAEVEVESEF